MRDRQEKERCEANHRLVHRSRDAIQRGLLHCATKLICVRCPVEQPIDRRGHLHLCRLTITRHGCESIHEFGLPATNRLHNHQDCRGTWRTRAQAMCRSPRRKIFSNLHAGSFRTQARLERRLRHGMNAHSKEFGFCCRRRVCPSPWPHCEPPLPHPECPCGCHRPPDQLPRLSPQQSCTSSC